MFYLILAGNNKPFRVTPCAYNGYYRYSITRGPALKTVLLFFYFVSICLSLCRSVCLYICLQLTSNFWKVATTYWFVYISERGFRARIKKLKAGCLLECLGILLKNQEKTLVSGFGSEQPLQQHSTPSCFVGPVCRMVVLWNMCFLFV